MRSSLFSERAACLAVSMIAVSAALGCSTPAPPNFDTGADVVGGDSASGDAPADSSEPDAIAVRCDRPGVMCLGSRMVRCSADGGVSEVRDCVGATGVCVDAIGCVACRPSERRCSSMGGVPEQCASDGSAWQTGTACNAGAFETCRAGECVSACRAAEMDRTYAGCEYWAAPVANPLLEEDGHRIDDVPFAVVLSNPQTQPVQVTVSGGGLTANVMRTIAAGAVETIELPWIRSMTVPNAVSVGARRNAVGSGVYTATPGATSVAYRVQSNAPVTAYQFNPLVFSGTAPGSYTYTNDASLLLPTSVLTRRYTVMSYSGWDLDNAAASQTLEVGGMMAIVGTTEAPTRVTVRYNAEVPASNGVRGGNVGTTETFMLARGDVVQLISRGRGNDLTGTTVEAANPVVVFGGHVCAQVPVGRVACDHLEEQLLPDEALGRRYAVTVFHDRPFVPVRVRVMAVRDGTLVNFIPSSARPSALLRAGEVLEFETDRDVFIDASQPVSVAQFMIGQGRSSAASGDPAMALVVPTEQYRADYAFLTPTTYTHSYINIVGPSGHPPMIDGRMIGSTESPIPGAELSSWSVEVAPGAHRLAGTGNDTRYGLLVYGVAPYTSYGFPGGLDVRPLAPQ